MSGSCQGTPLNPVLSDTGHVSQPSCVIAVLNLEGPVGSLWMRFQFTFVISLKKKKPDQTNNLNNTLVGYWLAR